MAKEKFNQNQSIKKKGGLGLQRKKMGRLHKEFYEQRLAKSKEQDAFQRTVMSVIKGLLDVIDANNKRIAEDLAEVAKKK
ncbi:MAG: hypothetical protein N3A57_04645 [Negativicutes bacterium]|nr:hypothetical protein [Negativicutes bacterium]